MTPLVWRYCCGRYEAAAAATDVLGTWWRSGGAGRAIPGASLLIFGTGGSGAGGVGEISNWVSIHCIIFFRSLTPIFWRR